MLVLGPSAAASDGCPDGGPCVVVHVGADETVVSLDEIAEWTDRPDAMQYPTRTSSGPGPDVEVPSGGLSIRALIQHVSPELGGFGVDAVTFVDAAIPRSSYVAHLRRASGDLEEDSAQDGFEGALVPVVYQVGSGFVGYVRPLRSESDVNVKDALQSDENGRVDITLHVSGDVVHPTITASDDEVETGQKVTVTAAFDDEPAAGLIYTWTFGAGPAVTTAVPQVSHRWTDASSAGYPVLLTVSSAADDTTGQSNQLLVVVTAADDPDPDGSDHHGPGGHHDNDHGTTTGPDHSQGHQGGATPDPAADPGAATGARGAGEEPGDGPTDPPPDPDRDPTPAVGGPRGSLTGIVLTGADVVPETQSGQPPTAPAARSGETDESLSLSWWLTLPAGLVALLALGGLSESRWLGRRRARRTGRMPA